jgi:hypothetical protein
MKDIKCPYDLNQFLIGEPIFENTFPEEECEQKKFYGDCYHCFSTAIAKRDRQLKNDVIKKIKAEIEEYKSREGTLAFSIWEVRDIIDKCNESEDEVMQNDE